MTKFLKWISAPLFSVFLLGAVSEEAKAVMLHFSPECTADDLQQIQTEDEHTWLELNTLGPTDSLATVRVGTREIFNVPQGQASCRIDLTENELRQLHLNGVDYCYGARTGGSGLADIRLEFRTGAIPVNPEPCHGRH